MKLVPFMLALHNYRVMDASFRSPIKKCIAYVVKALFFWANKYTFYKFIEHSLVPKGDYITSIFTKEINWEVLPASWYDEREAIPFADTELYTIKHRDVYLERCYGDYMQLPPKNQREYHITKTFWK